MASRAAVFSDSDDSGPVAGALRSGFIEKKGRANNTFKRRFFVLRDVNLLYYDTYTPRIADRPPRGVAGAAHPPGQMEGVEVDERRVRRCSRQAEIPRRLHQDRHPQQPDQRGGQGRGELGIGHSARGPLPGSPVRASAS